MKFTRFKLIVGAGCASSGSTHVLNIRLIEILIVVLFVAACGGPDRTGIGNQEPSPSSIYADPEPENERKEDEVLSLDAMDEFAALFSIGSLRRRKLPPGIKEVRIWIGIRPDRTRGVIITSNHAIFLPPVGNVATEKRKPVLELIPRIGWEEFWMRFESSGIWSLPPEPATERVGPRDDSDVVIVEIRDGDSYRNVQYGAPCLSEGDSAKKLVASVKEIGRELGLDFYNCSNA